MRTSKLARVCGASTMRDLPASDDVLLPFAYYYRGDHGGALSLPQPFHLDAASAGTRIAASNELASIPDRPEGRESWLPGNQGRGPGILLGRISVSINFPDEWLVDMG